MLISQPRLRPHRRGVALCVCTIALAACGSASEGNETSSTASNTITISPIRTSHASGVAPSTAETSPPTPTTIGTSVTPASTPATASSAPPSSIAALGTDTFQFNASPISDAVLARMNPSSWRPGCPVGPESLRYVTLSYYNFGGVVESGELVVHRDAVSAIEHAFSAAFASRFPIERMRLVDDYGGSDFDSIEANNTSAFNCRLKTGSDSDWSEHAYGKAIDINPIQNPYVGKSGTTSHDRSVPFVSRGDRPGELTGSDPLSVAFAESGWGWGGDWSSIKDYQHFSASGG